MRSRANLGVAASLRPSVEARLDRPQGAKETDLDFFPLRRQHYGGGANAVKPRKRTERPVSDRRRSEISWIDMRPDWMVRSVDAATRRKTAQQMLPPGNRTAAGTSSLLGAIAGLLHQAATTLEVIDAKAPQQHQPQDYAEAAARVFGRVLNADEMSTWIDVTTSPPEGPGPEPGPSPEPNPGPAPAPEPGPSPTPPPPPSPPNSTTAQPCVPVGASGFNSSGQRFVLLGDTIQVEGGRAWRDNNPGMMRSGPGMLRKDGFGPPGPFAIFPTFDAGWTAAWNELHSSRYQALTLHDAIATWAPATENNVGNYVTFVSQQTGILPTTPLNKLSTDQMTALLQSMYRFEGNAEGETWQRGDASAPAWAQELFNAPQC